MPFWDHWFKRNESEAASVKGAAVPFVGGGPAAGASGSGVQYGVSGAGRLAWFGSNVEGYDSLIGSRDAVDYDSYLPSDNSIVAACLNWINTSWATCRLQVGRMNGDEFEPVDNHPLEVLMRRPHPDYDGNWLVSAWITDLFDRGEYYANIVTKGLTGPPIQLQYLPARCVEPKAADDPRKSLVGWFNYSPGGGLEEERIEAVAMVYGRYSLDPNDPKRGKKPLYSARREIATDNLASEVAASLMKSPKPGGILSYDGDASAVDPRSLEEDMAASVQKLENKTSGGSAGGVVGYAWKAKFQQVSFNPKDLALDEARRKPEERVCALFNLPPVVVGLGAGLDKSTYNNLDNSIKMAWTDCMIPLMEANAAVLTQDVLPLFGNVDGLICRWDTSNVGVLQPDLSAERKDVRDDVAAGILTVNEARAERGLEPLPEPEPVDDEETQANGNGAGTTPAKPGAKSLRVKKDSLAESASRLYRVANAFRSALGNGETEAVDAMTRLLDAAQEDLTSRLLSLTEWIAKEEATGRKPSENLTAIQTRWRELSGQLDTVLSDLSMRGAEVVTDGQAKAAAIGVTSAEKLTTAAAGVTKETTLPAWNTLPTDTLESLAGFLADGSPVNVYLSRVAGQYVNQAQDVLFAGVARGAGAKEIADDMAKFGNGPRERYLTMVRTEVNRAAREASRRSYAANSDVVTTYIRLSAADSRTCPACWGEHGKEYPTSDPMHQHAQCRCVLIPKTKSMAELTGIDNLPDTRPVIESGETLFAKLSKDAQEEILGTGRFELWSQGKAKLADFAERSNDPVWGPTLSTATVGNAGARVSTP